VGAAVAEDPRERVAATLEGLNRINLQVVVLAQPDATRRAARERARLAAAGAGRSELVTEAVAAARETAMRAFSRGGFSGTWAATDWSISVANAGDRVAAAAAFEEAAIAAVVEDLVDEDTLEILRASAGELDLSSKVPSPGSLSALTDPGRLASRGTWSTAAAAILVMMAIGLWLGLGAGVGIFAIVAIAIALAVGRSGARP
jgi:hypothetical protein